MKMKNRAIIILTIFGLAGQMAWAKSFPDKTTSTDTIEVHFGDKGTILIQVESKEDLEALKEYDINSMLKDIDVPTKDELGEDENVILQDDDGTKYLKDSVEEDDEFRQLENEFSDTDKKDYEEKKEYNYERKARRFSGSKTDFVSALDFGINNYLENGSYPDANEQYTVRPWGSWYVGIMPTVQTHIGGKFALDYGGGISWYNFKFQDPRTKLVMGDEVIEFEQWDVELQASKSKLTVVHLNAHFVPMIDFGYRTSKRTYDDGFVQKKIRYRRNGFRIGAGGYVGTRIGSWQKLVWRSTGHKSKLREKDYFYLNNLRYGARFILGYGEVDIFVNYDMSTLFAENRGPELNAISFGLSF
jgi:hypothetical protein